MARKSSSVKEALLVIIGLLLIFYVLFNTFLRPIIPSSSILSEQLSAEDFYGYHVRNRGKVKVFMYDLPSRFTTGIIQSHALARGSSDPSKAVYPGHQHMGEWYMYSDLAQPESKRIGSPVIRVDDPEEADLFYVPVFSSLSLIVSNNRPANPPTPAEQEYSDEEMQLALGEYLEGQEYWKRNSGRDHVIMAGDPNALFRILDRVKNAVLLVSDFGRVRPDQGSLVKDVVVPYAHRIRAYEGDVGVANRSTLLFFMGNRYRKDGGRIRDSLFTLLEGVEDMIIKHGTQSRESRREASHGMHSSKFCLSPAGDTPSACRLFDAIVSLCVPVIVSDSIELPFEDLLDYTKFSVFVETETALKPGYLANHLRQIPPHKIVEYQKNLLKVRTFFEYANPKGTVNEIWRQVVRKLPSIKLMINRDKRLVRKDTLDPDCSCLCTNQTASV